MRTYDVYRVRTGKGLVDWCGTVEAINQAEAELLARALYPVNRWLEHLSVEESA